MSADQSTDFAALLQQHNQGSAHAAASEALTEVVAAVKATRKKGSVTVTIAVEPVKGRAGVVKVIDTVTRKVPAADAGRAGSIWYPDAAGCLHENDPNQGALIDKDGKAYAPPTEGTDPRTGTAVEVGKGLFSDQR